MSSNKPFPSSDLDVFKDNSLILDNFVNSQENEHPDRFGRKRPTITGIIKEAFNVRTDISNMNETLIGQSRWDAVPKNTSLSLGGDNGALNKQAQALFNRTEMLKVQAREALRRTYQEVGLNLVPGSFEDGGKLETIADVLLEEKTGYCYSWSGNFPKVVNKETLPSSEIEFVDKSSTTLRAFTATGISLSKLMHLPDPLETGLELSRTHGLELIIDCNCSYSTMVIKSGDTIRGVGRPVLRKKNNNKPVISPEQAPERPVGYLDIFSVNAFFIVHHEPNVAARGISVTGGIDFVADETVTLDCYAYIPRMCFSKITDLRLDSHYISETLDGFVFKDEYANTIGDIHILNIRQARFGFLWEDLYNGTYYVTGTSTNGYGLHTVNFRFPFRQKRHSYSKLSVCGGEAVGVKDEMGKPLPIVFDIEDSVVTLDAPSTEHLYGSFIRVKRTAGLEPASCTVNTPQANVAVFGTKEDKGAKLYDVTGGGQLILNGGFHTTAAPGYYLKFGGATNDSLMQLNAVDLNFVLNDIKNDTEKYTGIHQFNCMLSGYSMKLWGTTGDYSVSGQIPFENVESDPFNIRTDKSQATIKRSGYYSVKGSIRTSDAVGYLSIYIGGAERARTYFDDVVAQAGEQVSTYVDFDGRLNAGDKVELKVTFNKGVIKGNAWFDNKFTINMK